MVKDRFGRPLLRQTFEIVAVAAVALWQADGFDADAEAKKNPSIVNATSMLLTP
jgi:hypothetical protein